MPRRTAWPALASLDRRFNAEFRGDQLPEVFPRGNAVDLIRRGVLVDAGFVSGIRECICELQRGECDVRIDVHEGVHLGYCNEIGKPFAVAPDRLQRYRFDWQRWASWLRLKNRLNGAGPALGAGVLFVGAGKASGREFGLVVVAPGCRRAADVVMPEGVRQTGRALVALFLGEPAEGLQVDAQLPVAALGDDFGTLDGVALERVLDAAPVRVTRAEAVCMFHCRESPRGRPIDDSEYERLHQPDVRKTFDLFIDRMQCKVWCKGKPRVSVLDSRGRSTKQKRLGPVAIGLLADYVRRPRVPMLAKDTPTYRGAVTDGRSASVQLSEVRRSVRGQGFIRSGARSDKVGETPYYFDPGDMTWCLLEQAGE